MASTQRKKKKRLSSRKILPEELAPRHDSLKPLYKTTRLPRHLAKAKIKQTPILNEEDYKLSPPSLSLSLSPRARNWNTRVLPSTRWSTCGRSRLCYRFITAGESRLGYMHARPYPPTHTHTHVEAIISDAISVAY